MLGNHWIWLLALLAAALASPEAADAQALSEDLNPRLMVAGRTAIFADGPGSYRDFALVRFSGDRQLYETEDPRCPNTSYVELGSVPDQDAPGFVREPRIELPCENWRALRHGYLYYDREGLAGGVKLVVYGRGKLTILAGGENYTPIAAPVALAQVRLWIGEEYFMGRFYQPAVNRPRLVYFKPISYWAALGEQAAWDTLTGQAYRTEEALRFLRRATRRNRRDGRAHMMKAMVHLYEVQHNLVSWKDPTPEALYHLGKGHKALLKATPLLWDGERGDARILAFINGTTYQLARLAGDEEGVAEAFDAMEEAVEINPIFNNFGIFGAANTTDRDDPNYVRIMDVARDLIGLGPSAQCIFEQPEICGTAGLGPHSVSGSLTLVGDIFLKGGDKPAAQLAFFIANFVGRDDWPFQDTLDERVATIDERIALYANGDPEDDPPFTGFGEEGCVNCHGFTEPIDAPVE